MSAFVLTLVIGQPIKSLGIAVPKQTLYCYNKLLVRHLQVVFLFTYRVNSGSLARKLCRQFITLALRRIKQLYQIVRALQSIEPLRSRFWLNIRSGSDSAISCQLHTLGGIVGMVTICTVYQTYFRLASKISMQASPYHHARVKPFEPPKFNINYQKILRSVAIVKQGNTFLQLSSLFSKIAYMH